MSDAVFEKNGTVLTVRPEGRLDTATSPELEREMRQRLDGIAEVIMDFSKLEYISSGGLRLLLAIEQLLGPRGGGLKVVHANQYILEIFGMIGFENVITVEKD
ncbi:MAG: STAS domain-containing protein [Clostridia bacterium]|nr:STAS domain-containing protein [Clostridia bacterium]